MKKLLILVMLFCLSSMAGASYIQPQVGGATEISIMASDIVYLDLLFVYDGSSSPGNLTFADVLLTITGDVIFIGNEDITVHAQLGGTAAGCLNGIWYPDSKTCLISATSWAGGAPSGSIIFDHIGLHRTGLSAARVVGHFVDTIQGGSSVDYWDPLDVVNGGDGGASMPLTIYPIPEPVTIALLSFGGLLARKKR